MIEMNMIKYLDESRQSTLKGGLIFKKVSMTKV